MSNFIAAGIGELIGTAGGKIAEKALGELRGVLDEVLGGEENRERRELALKSLADFEMAYIALEAKKTEWDARLAIAEAQGQSTIQRVWRPWSALLVVHAAIGLMVLNLTMIWMGIPIPPEYWSMMTMFIGGMFALLGVVGYGRTQEKQRTISALSDIATDPLRSEIKANAKATRSMARARGKMAKQLAKLGLNEDQITAQLTAAFPLDEG